MWMTTYLCEPCVCGRKAQHPTNSTGQSVDLARVASLSVLRCSKFHVKHACSKTNYLNAVANYVLYSTNKLHFSDQTGGYKLPISHHYLLFRQVSTQTGGHRNSFELDEYRTQDSPSLEFTSSPNLSFYPGVEGAKCIVRLAG